MTERGYWGINQMSVFLTVVSFWKIHKIFWVGEDHKDQRVQVLGNGICCSLNPSQPAAPPALADSREILGTPMGCLRALGKLQSLLLRGFLLSPMPVPHYYCHRRVSDTPRGLEHNSRQKSGREQPSQTISPSCPKISVCYCRAEPSVLVPHHSSPFFHLRVHLHDLEGMLQKSHFTLSRASCSSVEATAAWGGSGPGTSSALVAAIQLPVKCSILSMKWIIGHLLRLFLLFVETSGYLAPPRSKLHNIFCMWMKFGGFSP